MLSLSFSLSHPRLFALFLLCTQLAVFARLEKLATTASLSARRKLAVALIHSYCSHYDLALSLLMNSHSHVRTNQPTNELNPNSIKQRTLTLKERKRTHYSLTNNSKPTTNPNQALAQLTKRLLGRPTDHSNQNLKLETKTKFERQPHREARREKGRERRLSSTRLGAEILASN